MLSNNLEKTLRDAYQIATINKHEFVTLEHLLFSLTNDKDALSVLKACNIDIDLLQKNLNNFISKELNNLKDNFNGEPKLTNAFQRVDFENVQKIKEPSNVQDILSRLYARAADNPGSLGTTTQEESSSNNDRILEDSTLTEDTQGNKVKRRGRKKKTLMTIM